MIQYLVIFSSDIRRLKHLQNNDSIFGYLFKYFRQISLFLSFDYFWHKYQWADFFIIIFWLFMAM